MTEVREVTIAGSSGIQGATLSLSNVGSYCLLTLKLADGRIWTATEPDYFECLVSIRRSLEKNDLAICCQGARKDVWASGMARDMGAGLRAYVLKEGRNASVDDLVDIFDPAPAEVVATVAEQEIYAKKWQHQPKTR